MSRHRKVDPYHLLRVLRELHSAAIADGVKRHGKPRLGVTIISERTMDAVVGFVAAKIMEQQDAARKGQP